VRRHRFSGWFFFYSSRKRWTLLTAWTSRTIGKFCLPSTNDNRVVNVQSLGNTSATRATHWTPIWKTKSRDSRYLDRLHWISSAPCIDCQVFFCPPTCQLPFKIDIIKHRREIAGKSTAIHAALLAPDDVTIYIYPNLPKYTKDNKVTRQFIMFTIAYSILRFIRFTTDYWNT
jgi:hypothetical protein